jgi:hypothetical protein
VRELTFYFMELSLPEYRMLRYLPSMLAAAALLLAMKSNAHSPAAAQWVYLTIIVSLLCSSHHNIAPMMNEIDC